jgi:hypothetical protein
MKLAVLALTTLIFAGCTRTLYNHRADFSPNPAKGAWTEAYRDARNHKDPAHPGKRPLFGRTSD